MKKKLTVSIWPDLQMSDGQKVEWAEDEIRLLRAKVKETQTELIDAIKKCRDLEKKLAMIVPFEPDLTWRTETGG